MHLQQHSKDPPRGSPLSYRGPHPTDAAGLGGSGAELVVSQRRCGAGEQIVLEQRPALEALRFEKLVVLTQKLHRVVVLSEAAVAIPLTPELGGHACGKNGGLHHLDG